MGIEAIFQRYHAKVEPELRSIVGDNDLNLYHMMRYHLGWVDGGGNLRQVNGGKLLRSTLCLLTCEAVGGDWRRALPAAAAVELMHNFSLIHDDIQDAGVKRRHRATVWVVWGKEQAINAGDAMHALSQLAVLRLEGVSEEKVLHLARLLDEACLRLCQGQNMDMAFEDHLDVDVNAYLKMIADKTASLFEWAAHAGALLGTGDEVTVEHLAHFGRNLGIVYQIRDDILGIWGEEEATGKSPASDILSKKKTLPVILGLERMGRGGELFQIYRKESLEPQDIPRVVEILDQLGVREEADEMAKRYHAEALSQLKVSRLAPHARGGLEEMASLILKG